MFNELSESSTLDSQYEIENILIAIKQKEDEVEYLTALSKYRDEKTSREISKLQQNLDLLRKVILNTMKATEPNKKTIDFPGVGKVSRREGKSNWLIKDEDKMLSFLEKQGAKSKVVKTQTVVSKTEANKVFDLFKDQKIDVPGVEYVPAKETLSISFEDKSDTKEDEKEQSPKKKSTSVSIKDSTGLKSNLVFDESAI